MTLSPFAILQLLSLDKLSRLSTANAVLKTYVMRAQQQYCQRIWKQFLIVSKAGGVDAREFKRFLGLVSAVGNEERTIVFAERMRLHEVMSGSASAPGKSFKQLADAASVKMSAACIQVPRSMYLRVMHAALLRHLAASYEHFQFLLYALAWSLPPFGSWATSTPSCEDDWLDPAEEVFVDSSSALSWEEQVGLLCCYLQFLKTP